jgi:hypothetical protein
MRHITLIFLTAAAFVCGCTTEKTPPPVQHTVQRPIQPVAAQRTTDDLGLPLVINISAPEVPAEIANPTRQTP